MVIISRRRAEHHVSVQAGARRRVILIWTECGGAGGLAAVHSVQGGGNRQPVLFLLRRDAVPCRYLCVWQLIRTSYAVWWQPRVASELHHDILLRLMKVTSDRCTVLRFAQSFCMQ